MGKLESLTTGDLTIIDSALYTYIYHETDESLIELARTIKKEVKEELFLRIPQPFSEVVK